MRLFVAIELSDSARQHLARVSEKLQTLGLHGTWVDPAKMHLTLKFIGEVADPHLPVFLRALASVQLSGRVNLHADHLLFFPPRGSARVLGASLAGDTEALSAWQTQIENACADCGVPRESRPFTPHLTLARFRNGLPERLRQDAEECVSKRWPGPAFAPQRIVLMQSIQNSAANTTIYQPLAHWDVV